MGDSTSNTLTHRRKALSTRRCIETGQSVNTTDSAVRSESAEHQKVH